MSHHSAPPNPLRFCSLSFVFLFFLHTDTILNLPCQLSMHNALYRYFGSRARGPCSLFLFRVTGAEEKAIQWLRALGWDEEEQ